MQHQPTDCHPQGVEPDWRHPRDTSFTCISVKWVIIGALCRETTIRYTHMTLPPGILLIQENLFHFLASHPTDIPTNRESPLVCRIYVHRYENIPLKDQVAQQQRQNLKGHGSRWLCLCIPVIIIHTGLHFPTEGLTYQAALPGNYNLLGSLQWSQLNLSP